MDVHMKNLGSKLNRSYYVMQSLKGKTRVNIFKKYVFCNFHSHLRYGILFKGGDGESNTMFELQKKVMGLISNVGEILPARYCLRH